MPAYAAFAPVSRPIPPSSSLLASTPPSISRALSQAYPFISLANSVLGWLTWSSNDGYKSVLVVFAWIELVTHFEIIIRYFLQPLGVVIFTYVAVLVHRSATQEPPSLDAIVASLDSLAERWILLTAPVVALNLKTKDIARFAVTAIITYPLYAVAGYVVFEPRTICLWLGIIILTWHSLWFKVTRSILLRIQPLRKLIFWFTGIDAVPATVIDATDSVPSRPVSTSPSVEQMLKSSKTTDSVKFTFVLYENQRRWLGIGWTSNMLSYERTPWTDEYLNDANPPEIFTLPNSDGTGMRWQWLNKSWLLDLTNDGALNPKSKAKTSADPGEDEGFVYYDTVWSSPTPVSGFTKYTRRRRWIRTAVLSRDPDEILRETHEKVLPNGTGMNGLPSESVISTSSSNSTAVDEKSGDLRQRL